MGVSRPASGNCAKGHRSCSCKAIIVRSVRVASAKPIIDHCQSPPVCERTSGPARPRGMRAKRCASQGARPMVRARMMPGGGERLVRRGGHVGGAPLRPIAQGLAQPCGRGADLHGHRPDHGDEGGQPPAQKHDRHRRQHHRAERAPQRRALGQASLSITARWACGNDRASRAISALAPPRETPLAPSPAAISASRVVRRMSPSSKPVKACPAFEPEPEMPKPVASARARRVPSVEAAFRRGSFPSIGRRRSPILRRPNRTGTAVPRPPESLDPEAG